MARRVRRITCEILGLKGLTLYSIRALFVFYFLQLDDKIQN